ncbi:hypothetical protein VE25_13985 [Devosia geojensis]|uniref:J domain-containing protein n=1 Tax=Devosia geojensis TaxID=443610 RepID=A0A0F5FQV1_9HYPH|nr:DnaJ domain-containing protein [Devosia geojensis]KKB11198.1 hypothetical protein VE25_13985 [Devosia geojensis]
MTYFFIGGAILLAALAAWQGLRRLGRHRLMLLARWAAGGGAAIIGVLLLLARRIDIAVFLFVAAYSILARGRLGPFSFGSDTLSGDSISKVRSRYFAMELDHDTGEVKGRALAGQFAGLDLMQLGEMETRALIEEISWDPDSVSLLESWLDANRAGWREYFEETAQGEDEAQAASADPVAQAYEILGLKPGATPEEIRAAHRELMKGVHPDRGGSSYLASKINEARDLLLKNHEPR